MEYFKLSIVFVHKKKSIKLASKKKKKTAKKLLFPHINIYILMSISYMHMLIMPAILAIFSRIDLILRLPLSKPVNLLDVTRHNLISIYLTRQVFTGVKLRNP